jgi:Exostosin family
MAGDVLALLAPKTVKVLLASAYAKAQPGPAAAALAAAAQEAGQTFELTNDPDIADLILFVEYHPWHDPYFFDVLRHPLRRRHPHKCVLYTDADRVIPLMPMLSPSIERWQYHAALCRAFPYVTREYHNEAAGGRALPSEGERRYLFSFAGASDTHPVRARLLALRSPDARLIDTGAQRAWLLQGEDKRRYESAYVEACRDSAFVLCPRGAGPSSYRLYEAMQLGRAPVVISDQWVPHAGPDWDSFCVRVAESEIERLPGILRARTGEARAMGERARHEWERWVAPDVALQRMVEAAADLVASPRRWFHPLQRWGQFARPFHLRNLARWFVRLRRSSR